MSNPNDLTIITAADMTSTINGPAMIVNSNNAFSFQATYTGSPVGNFSVQTSGFTTEFGLAQTPSNTSWSTIAASTMAVPANTSPATLDYSRQVAFNWIRFVYTPISGSGRLTVTFNGR